MTQPSYSSGLLFTRAHKVVRGRTYALLGKYDLTPTYWSILGATMRSPEGIRLSSVAVDVGVKAPLVTVMAQELMKRGLIMRIPHHTDRRAKLLIMTPKGKKLAGVIERELSAEINYLLSGLTDSEVAAFQKTLGTIIQNAAA